MAILGKSGKLVSLGLPGPLALHRLAEAVAFAIHLENRAEVGEAVEERRGQAPALGDRAPRAAGEFARREDAAALTTVGEGAGPPSDTAWHIVTTPGP
jgi:hypothetical protein